jgi:hypothetical protein
MNTFLSKQFYAQKGDACLAQVHEECCPIHGQRSKPEIVE